MSKEQSIFPEIIVSQALERVIKVGRFVGERLFLMQDSDIPYSGGAALLDDLLNETEVV